MKREYYNSIEECHGAIFAKKEKRKSEKHPSHYGFCKADGVVYHISAWYYPDKKSFSLRLEEFDESMITD